MITQDMITQQYLQVDGVAPVVYLHNIVIEQQPVAVALDYGDVVSSVGATEEERESRTRQLLMISVSCLPHLPQCTTTPMRSYILSALSASSDCVCVCVSGRSVTCRHKKYLSLLQCKHSH